MLDGLLSPTTPRTSGGSQMNKGQKKAIRSVLDELNNRLPKSSKLGFMPSDEVVNAMNLLGKALIGSPWENPAPKIPWNEVD